MSGADFSRTCEGCPHVRRDGETRGKPWFRCMGEGPEKGRHIGTGTLLPYVPAWCPEMTKGRIAYGTKKFVPSVRRGSGRGR